MTRMNHFKRLITDPIYRLDWVIVKGFSDCISDEHFLKWVYRLRTGKRLNLQTPRSFNEKLQWLKLHDRNPRYARMVDKYEVKQYIADVLGKDYVIPLLGVWENFDSIDFNNLPYRFVLKCTHDSGGIVICKDKERFDSLKARQLLERSLQRNFYMAGREWPYKQVKARIIAEQYMENIGHESLQDYKFFCFNGQCRCFKVDFDRFTEHRANYYTPEGQLLRFGEVMCPPNYDREVRMPVCLEQMIKMSEQLSQNIPFLRVDFYEVKGQVYFGECTFYPASGFGLFIPDEWDMRLGEWLQLPNE